MSRVSFQPGRFDQISSYDAPGALFSQIMNGQFSSETALNDFFDPSKLSPLERDTITARLKQSSGDNRIVNTLIDTALNPWVWMFALTTPAATEALAGGARSIFTSSSKYLATVKDHAGVLQALGFTPPLQTLNGTAAPAAAAQAQSAYRGFIRETASQYEEAKLRFLQLNDLPHLNPNEVGNSVKKAKADYAQRLLKLSLEGWDQERRTTIGNVKVKYFTPGLDGKMQEITQNQWLKTDKSMRAVAGDVAMTKAVVPIQIENGALEQAIQDVPGLGDLRDAIRGTLQSQGRKLYGKLDGGKWVVDEVKLGQAFDLMGNPLFNGQAAKNSAGGLDFIHKLMGPEMAMLMEEGALSKDQWVGMMKHVANNFIEDGAAYFPRNVTQTIMPNGEVMSFENFIGNKQGRAFRMPSSSVLRTRADELLHPDDLKWVADTFNGHLSEDFLGKPGELGRIQKVEKMMRMAADEGRNVTVQRMNVAEGLAKHFQSTAETYAYGMTPLNDETTVAMQEMLRQRKAAGATHVQQGSEEFRRNASNPNAKAVPIDTDMTTVGPDEAPWGGFNLADAMYQSHALMPGSYQRDTLMHLVIPASTGRSTTNHVLAKASMIASKDAAGAFADSMLGKGIERLGGTGQRVIQGMREYAEREVGNEVGSGVGRGLTKLLYMSHLGANLSSAVLNGMQPWLYGANWLGVDNVIKGYGKAFNELGSYMKDRISTYGHRMITPEEQSALARKHFKWADLDGEDFLGITRGAEETIDALSARAAPGRASRVGDAFFETIMAPFQKVEWLNRSVIAHATEEFHTARGTAMGVVKNDVRRMNAATQFGMDFLNTPPMFQTDNPGLAKLGGLGTVPFMRQFTHYPIRALTTLLDAAPEMGGSMRKFGVTGFKTTHPVGIIAHDMMRGMAISALGFEMGKNLLHADLSRGLFAQSAFQWPQQFIDDKGDGGIIPAPPILDVAKTFGKFLETGDLEFLKQTLPRFIPGGIALSKAVGVAPELPTWAGVLTGQKTYADWAHPTPEGNVGVYKSDGSLIDFQPVSSLLAKGVGADLGAGGETGKIDKMLASNSDEIKDYRTRYMGKLLNGDSMGAESIARDMENRFGFPLTVTKSQLMAAQKLRMTPKSERIAQRIPEAGRKQYLDMLATQPSRFNVSADILRNNMSSKARDPSRMGGKPLDPAIVEQLQRTIKSLHPLPTQPKSDSPFGTFGDFSQ